MPVHHRDQRRGAGGGSTYKAQRIIGSGAFGVVYEAKVQETGETVAIKKVFEDKRFKNRELPTLKQLKHPNIVTLKHAFHTAAETPTDLYLNLVMEYVPDNLYQVMKYYAKVKDYMPSQLVKLYSYQLLRAVGYVNAKGFAHRDIKPQNVLICPSTHTLKLCDFGSAKKLAMGEDNVAYICSRFYRAPELIFGSTGYTSKVDIWSTGCVIAEMCLGCPLFPGQTGVDQLVEIIKVLGTPTAEQVAAMNPKYKDFNPRVFPRIKPIGLANALRGRPQMDRGFEALLRVLLRFEPATRMSPILALCLEYFEQLRNQKDLGQEIENAGGLPKELFKFTSEELMEVGDSRRLAPRRVESPQIVVGPDNTTHTTPSSSSFKSDTFQPLSNSATITTNSS
ncbi:glycogen synthase kinase-3 alpha, putative [Perkinsus marinus ATCC 50983]|uniref:Glycogen synthase kinase-3 alpha, putative n=1 Tax=Perkinsus marinus (strain ATCC 50983 / TXsc) TaxID=423536 RepID=C5KAC6_PERM5|nr:glycogen synthase kinase-3 alpha, putative [Perkinsus marinus ATCC 50983]EER18587.1 glycogen synthase kinase-3 alpha, putative [Perkinsus marinus ATCC 50983]|eukprot:XP_002786791.1 glycogen synthase kinase-3 alpha, putative [Perkinsus marinus ATCC 50983]